MKHFFYLTFILLTGCGATLQPVKDATANKQTYLDTNFTINALTPQSAAVFGGHNSTAKLTRTIDVNYEINSTANSLTNTYNSLESHRLFSNGFVKSHVEALSNGIVSYGHFKLTYRGFINLIFQSYKTSSAHLNTSKSMKNIIRFDKEISNPEENKEYIFIYENGFEQQLINYRKQSTICKTEKWFEASTISPSLSGKAITLTCNFQRDDNGQVFLKKKYHFIENIGITLLAEISRTNVNRIFSVKSISIQNH